MTHPSLSLTHFENVVTRGLTESSTPEEQLAYYEAQMEIALARRPRRSAATGTRRTDNRPHVIYILRNAAGEPLYVGISLSVIERLSSHSQKHWFGEVARIDIERAPHRASALGREAYLITVLQPPYNVAGMPK